MDPPHLKHIPYVVWYCCFVRYRSMKESAIWWKLENLKAMFGMCLIIIIGFVNIARGIETIFSFFFPVIMHFQKVLWLPYKNRIDTLVSFRILTYCAWRKHTLYMVIIVLSWDVRSMTGKWYKSLHFQKWVCPKNSGYDTVYSWKLQKRLPF